MTWLREGSSHGAPDFSFTDRYRGYSIEGTRLGLAWQIHVRPISPDLPILRYAAFAIPSLRLSEAAAEARREIDRVLAL